MKQTGMIRYEAELCETAYDNYGYFSWRQLLIDKYKELQSTRNVGKALGRSEVWVNRQLKKMGIPLRKRGGLVYTKWQGKNIICSNCGEKTATKMGVCHTCYSREYWRKHYAIRTGV